MQHFLLCSMRPCRNAWSVMALVATSSTSSSKAQTCFWLTWLTGNNREGPGRVLWTRGWNAKVYVEVETQNSCFARKSWGCFFSCECQSMLQKKIVLQLEFEVLHLWQDESWKKHPAFCVFDLQVRTKFRELIWYFRSVSSDVREVYRYDPNLTSPIYYFKRNAFNLSTIKMC